jgi:membrane protease YdiL (CAAX protease family)
MNGQGTIMLGLDKSSSCRVAIQAPVKIHEIIFVWLVAMLAWDGVLRYLNRGVLNLIYLQWGAVALTMIISSKYFIRRENLTVDEFMGENLSRHWILDMSVALLGCVLLGLASWAILVFLSATIDVEWAYGYWQLITAAEFEEITWRPSWLVIYILCAGILVPISEEIVFRGFVLRRLREKYGLKTAVMMSSFLFSLIHFNKDFLGAFFIGIVLAVLALKFSSLYAPMIVHGMYNTVVSVARCGLGQFMVVDKQRIDSIGYWLPELILLSVCTMAVLAYLWFGLAGIRSEPDKST